MKRNTIAMSAAAAVIIAGSIPAIGALASTGEKPAEETFSLGLGDGEQAVVKDVVTTPSGDKVTRYERTYKGLKVVNGRFAAVQPEGQGLRATRLENKPAISLQSSSEDTKPTLTAAQAKAKVPTAKLIQGARLTKQTAELVVHVNPEGKSVLAYDVYTEGEGTTGFDVAQHTFVDAHTGAIVGKDSEVMMGDGNGVYVKDVQFGTKKEGRGYTFGDGKGNQVGDLNGGVNGNGSAIYDDDDKWGKGKDVQAQGVDAQFGIEKAHEYFLKVHGRDGIWGNGKGVTARIRWKNCFVNAQWNGRNISLGEGQDCKKPLTQLDVIAHEFTHGVTGNTGDLVYDKESGGLNEAMSDIFGTMVEFYANNPGDVPDYNMGEMIDIFGNGKPLRYMDKPSKDGRSQDCWSPEFATGNIDVHFTNAPMNHAFYLMSEGSGQKTVNGVQYDSPTCNGKAVSPIGRDKAAKIVFGALTSPTLPATSTYKQFRDEMIKFTKTEFGGSSAECHGVANAMDAVSAPEGSQRCDGEAPAPTTEPTATPTTDPTATPTDEPTIPGDSPEPEPTVTPTDEPTIPGDSPEPEPTVTPTGEPSSPAEPGDTGVLGNGSAVTVAGTPQDLREFTVTPPAGATKLTIQLDTKGAQGVSALMVKRDAKATPRSWDCRPALMHNRPLTCTFTNPKGVYHVRVQGYTKFSGSKLSASWS